MSATQTIVMQYGIDDVFQSRKRDLDVSDVSWVWG